MRHLPARIALLLTISASPLALAASSDPTLAQAQQLLDQHQAQAAFDLLNPLLDKQAGNPDYDYLYGLAAFETGKLGMAAFAFERCLAVDPRNGPCRVQMARTHLAMGENQSARRELETIQRSDPPAEVKALVSQYLGVTAKQEAGEKRHFGAYAQLGLGYDSNVTSTTADSQIAIPVFGGLLFNLSGVSSKQEDSFAQAEAGANFTRVLDPAWTVLADASISTRQYQDVDSFNNQIGNIGLGMAWRQGPNSVLTKLQAQDYRLDDNDFRSLYGVLAQYQYAYSDSAAASVYLQLSHLDYHFTTPDAARYTLGAGYSRAFDGRYAPALYAGLYGGREDSEGPGFLSQDFYGLRLGGSLGLSETLRLTSALSVEQRKFDDPDTVFLDTREDTAIDISLGAIYQVSRQFSLRPNYTFTSNDSNIVLSDYDRHVVSLDLRYEM